MKDADKVGDTPTDSPSVSSKADTPIPEAGSSHDATTSTPEIIIEDDKTWPSVVDLNTRLRRVISSYQRNVNIPITINKKEDVIKNLPKIPGMKQGMEIEITNQTGGTQTTSTTGTTTTTTEPPLNMQGWDLQQLAMYILVSVVLIVLFFKLNFKAEN